ncbi:MAG TPA: hypothetical protein PLR06_14660 [Cyclobacteriaceae bacterium]|nr:hypothetical protein [Cyclobacteriaceae bacterium]
MKRTTARYLNINGTPNWRSAHSRIVYAVITIILFQLSFNCTTVQEKKATGTLRVVGKMRKVMQVGDLSVAVNLDTISNKSHLYGVGPLDSLRGEIMLLDG